MNIHLQVFVQTYIFSPLGQKGVKLLGHMVILCLTFWEIDSLSSRVNAPFYFAPISMWSSNFSTSLSTFAAICHSILIYVYFVDEKFRV